MALFSFGDIKITNDLRIGAPSSSPLGIGNEYNVMKFPLDIGNYDKGHYIVIHVNKQIKSAFPQATTSDKPTVIANRENLDYATWSKSGGNLAEKVTGTISDIAKTVGLNESDVSGKTTATNDSTGLVGGALNKFKETVGKLGSKEFAYGGVRTIERSVDTIVLYMPDTLVYSQAQNYPGMELGKSLMSGAVAAGTSIFDAINGKINGGEFARNLTPFIGAAAQMSGKPLMVAAAVGLQGMVLNPQLELIYSSPEFRTFRFEFMLYPRSKQEATEVQRILEKLRFHQAPEVDTTTKGFFMIPPSEFDIKFYYNGKENPNIPKISTCVMTTLDSDYAPNGFAAYEEFENNSPEMGGTGMPVGIRLMMEFKETEIMLKNHYTNQKPMDTTDPTNGNNVPGAAAIQQDYNIGMGGVVGSPKSFEATAEVNDTSGNYTVSRDATFPKIFDNNEQYYTEN